MASGPERFNLLKVPSGGVLVLSAHPAAGGAFKPALQALQTAGARLLVSLLPTDELASLGLHSLQPECEHIGLAWAHCPIADFSAPGWEFELGWRSAGPRVHALLDSGNVIALHCRAGLGRTGTVAAHILIERGMPLQSAMQLVRETRPGSIETDSQEAYLQALAATFSPEKKAFDAAKTKSAP